MGKGILNRGTQVHKSKLKYNRLTIAKKFNCEDNMSGGHFKYIQSTLKTEVDFLKEEIRLNKPEFPEDVLQVLKYTQFIMEKTVELMDEADWLFSGNITEQSFKEGTHKCKKEIITHVGQRMEDDGDIKTFDYEDLKTEYNMSDKQIAQLDREAQKILGNAIVMIDGTLRDEECTAEEAINRALVFISITMGLIEKNFNEVLSQNMKKEVLN